jgi:hypothetical protein
MTNGAGCVSVGRIGRTGPTGCSWRRLGLRAPTAGRAVIGAPAASGRACSGLTGRSFCAPCEAFARSDPAAPPRRPSSYGSPRSTAWATVIAPLGSPELVPGEAATNPNSTARNVPRPRTRQMTSRTNTCGFCRRKLRTSRISSSTLAAQSKKTGGDLLSQALASQVPSALRGLTALFGMGRGVSPSP